ncbi:MAG: helix-turn-helix transcriptional regulator [Clostridia bacterium]|nr:helix-turn-helix transcriptional regulator [Clostridia bacterium]
MNNTYETVKTRLLMLCDEKRMSIHKLALESAVAPSTIKNILYGKSKNPGIVTIKMLCDGLGITLTEFFDTDDFKKLEQEII